MEMNLKDIILMPIDLPKLNLDRQKVLEYFDARKLPHQDWAWVNFKPMNKPIDPDLLKLFPDLDEKLRALPLLDYENNGHFDFREQIVNNKPHQDPIAKSLADGELGPTAYKNLVMRDMLETFYVLPTSSNPDIVQYDQRPRNLLSPVFPVLPSDTDWFVLNNHVGYHGSFMAPAEYRKITMFIAGRLDTDKHLELITRSVEKYKDYIIYN
jgi:hypothetical protein